MGSAGYEWGVLGIIWEWSLSYAYSYRMCLEEKCSISGRGDAGHE